ncbi:MAG: cache domain-containing protein [Bacteroidota bacterium]
MIRDIRRIFIILAAMVFVFFVVELFSFFNQTKNDEESATARVTSELKEAKNKFEGRLKELMLLTESIAADISKSPGDSSNLMVLLKSELGKNEDVFGLGVAFDPHTFIENRRLFAPYFIRRAGNIQLEFIEDSYDYLERDWFKIPMKEGKAWFEPPYYGEVAKTIMAEYSVPIFDLSKGDSAVIGIVYLDYSLEDISKAVDQLDLGKSGYGMMFSRDGILIAHPEGEKILAQENISDFSKEWETENLITLFDSIEVEGQPFVEAINTTSSISCRIFISKIEASDWRLAAVFVEDAFKTDSVFINQVVINLTSAVVLMALLLFFYFLYQYEFKVEILSKIVPFIVGIFLFAIITVWYSKIYQSFNIFQQEKSYPVAESIGLKRFLDNQDSLRVFYREPAIQQLPTGVFVKHIEFDGSHNIQISGVIWQKYSSEILEDKIAPAIRFISTAPDAEAESITEIYRKYEEDFLIVGWDFKVEVREKMHYGLYPLDRERISLRIDHPDLSKNIQLIPDLSSYDNVIATGLPGVDKDIILPEWKTEQSYFDFQPHDYNVNFGLMSAADRDYKYNLGFNVILKRKFLWPTMANIIPLATITILLFLALLSTIRGKSEKKSGNTLFSGFGLLELCAAFLFVAILTHIDLRSNLVVNYIMYMDYFYFHVYFTIIICSLSAVLLNKVKHQKQMNAVRLLYWPLLLGSLFVFTAIRFY